MTEPPAGPVALHRVDAGRGPALLFLHGLGGDHAVWNAVTPRLSEQHRTIAVDLRGHGRSPAPAGGPYDFPALQGDLVALLDDLRIERVHLIGLSAGAYLALAFTLDHPERVRSLVSIAGGSSCDKHTQAIGDRWARTYREEGPDAYVLRLVKDLYYPDWAEAHLDVVDRLREQAREGDFAAFARWGAAIRTFDVRGRVGRVNRPTLVVHGMDDQVVDVAHARLLRQSIPGAELRLLAQTGHLVPIERPDETVVAVQGWVAKVEAASPPPGA